LGRGSDEDAMAYREVTRVETKEVLRQWLAGAGNKRIAARVGVDAKTVRRYVSAARSLGLEREHGEAALTEELLTALRASLHGRPGRQRGEAWEQCEAQREFIAQRLAQGLKLSKLRKLLLRHGVQVPYATLHRFAVAELGFGRTAATVPIADCEPGSELQVDTGWVGYLEPDALGKRRRFRAWIFTAVFSRHRFVWPCFKETTAEAIEACEQAWQFFGGIFRVLLPDNTKAIVQQADPLNPLLNATFLEYAQARGFVVDPARVRKPRDKGRVERTVPTARDDCFAGETLRTLVDARELAERWCRHDYGARRHTRTQRLPLECFEAEEKPRLLPRPAERYETPCWSDPKVGRDHLAQVAKALYSLPTRFIGQRLRARADRTLVRFYDRGALVKTHSRQPPGGRSIDPSDFPPHKTAYALRDVAFLKRQAAEHGEAIGRFAEALLDVPLPWTRMRRVYALLGLVRRYGVERVEQACRVAIEAEMFDVTRLERMVLAAAAPPSAATTATVPKNASPARHLRSASEFALTLSFNPRN
jgi:transposase